jgi:hypothetical protein
MVAFAIAGAGFARDGRAHLPLFAPRVSLSLALDWNNLARRAIRQPRREVPPAPPARHRHAIPPLGVTDGAPAPEPVQHDVAAAARAEVWVRRVTVPQYVTPFNSDARFKLRSMYLVPFIPYLGCYGLSTVFETDAVLR